MSLILKLVSLGVSEVSDDTVAVGVGFAKDGDGCESDGTFKLAKGLLPADFTSVEDALARFGVANGLFPIAGFSASFVEAVLGASDELENAGPSGACLPKMLVDVVDDSAFDPGFSVVPSIESG